MAETFGKIVEITKADCAETALFSVLIDSDGFEKARERWLQKGVA